MLYYCLHFSICVSSLLRGHANLLCIVPMLMDDPRRESFAPKLSSWSIRPWAFPKMSNARVACDTYKIIASSLHPGGWTRGGIRRVGVERFQKGAQDLNLRFTIRTISARNMTVAAEAKITPSTFRAHTSGILYYNI